MTNIIAGGRALAEKATARPWKLVELKCLNRGSEDFRKPYLAVKQGDHWLDKDMPNEDAAYIVHACNNFPALCDRIEAQEREIAELRAELEINARCRTCGGQA